MGEETMRVISVFFFLIAVFSTGCTVDEPKSGVSHQSIQITITPSQIIPNTSARVLTPEMESRALAIALNNSEIKYYRDHRIEFEMQGVELPEEPFISVVGQKEYKYYFPVVKIKTKTAYLYLFIDLENQDTYYIQRLSIRETPLL